MESKNTLSLAIIKDFHQLSYHFCIMCKKVKKIRFCVPFIKESIYYTIAELLMVVLLLEEHTEYIICIQRHHLIEYNIICPENTKKIEDFK